MHLGATCFSVYNTSSPEQIEYVVGDAANRVVVTEQQFLERVLEAREQVATLEHVVVVDGEAPAGTISLAELEAMGEPDFDFEAAWRAVEPDDVLCLIYTSGTTGPPKGVQLTHANMVAEWQCCDRVHAAVPGGRSISFLPSAHVADRWSQHYAQMIYGTTVYCCPDPRQMVAYTIEVRPTLWGGVPRIWEKLKTALEAAMEGEQDAGKRRATESAMEVAAASPPTWRARSRPSCRRNGSRPTSASSPRCGSCSDSTRSNSSRSGRRRCRSTCSSSSSRWGSRSASSGGCRSSPRRRP
jgi:long-subunit acyl-CoA synthetase (AMP-forming)